MHFSYSIKHLNSWFLSGVDTDLHKQQTKKNGNTFASIACRDFIRLSLVIFIMSIHREFYPDPTAIPTVGNSIFTLQNFPTAMKIDSL